MVQPVTIASTKIHDVSFDGRWLKTGVVNHLAVDYRIENFCHPLVGALVDRLNQGSLKDALDPAVLAQLSREFFDEHYDHHGSANSNFDATFAQSKGLVGLEQPFPRLEIDVDHGGAFANYNWELLFHIPVAVAIHLSKTQRFAEAQRWFHLVFDPSDPSGDYWRCLALQGGGPRRQIDVLLKLLASREADLTATEVAERQSLLAGYIEIMRRPFQPFAVARTRLLSFQFMVVMRYLDNLLAWGDSLFAQDTSETVGEATQIYVLGATLLGPKPQQVPTPRSAASRTYAQLKQSGNGLDVTGNAMVQLESLFPFNYGLPQGAPSSSATAPLFGMVRALYFCVPRNDKLLGYWDLFADRLGKIRAGLNLEGVVRRLALFDPPIDPALLVRAAAAGVDIGAAVAGMNEPFVPVRASVLLPRAVELAAEVRALGGALLAALEKRDTEDLSLMRQNHEMSMLARQRDVRFIQWKQAEEATQGVLRARATTLDRYKHSLRQLGLTADETLAPDHFTLQRQPITEESFDDLHDALVEAFDKPLPALAMPPLRLVAAGADGQSGATGTGSLFLTQMEHHELNELLPEANNRRVASFVLGTLASVLAYIPDLDAKLAFWGLGAGARVFGGAKMSTALNAAAGIAMGTASLLQESAAMAARTASYQRRADDWTFQCNQAARELMQQGRQLIGALIAEQSARKEYESVIAQAEHASEINDFLTSKFTGRDLHHWMQGELSRLHRAYFDFAIYTARKAESAVKYELMRPEVDGTAFVRGDYWDGGRRGLLAGEALHLDVKRLELAFAENNGYEDVMNKQVSLRRLDPLALLQLQATGECSCSIPEWIFDLDRPGHFMRRIRRVKIDLPGVVGPYTSAAARLNLLRSSVRLAAGGAAYARQGMEDRRFKDYGPAAEFTVSLKPGESPEPPSARDQLLPCEGHGVQSEWRIKLPKSYRQYDYRSASDVVMDIQYTARPGGATFAAAAEASVDEVAKRADGVPFAIMISVADEMSADWDRFVTGTTPNLEFKLGRRMLPYLLARRSLSIISIRAHVIDVAAQKVIDGNELPAAARTQAESDLNDMTKAETPVSLQPDAAIKPDRALRLQVIVQIAVK